MFSNSLILSLIALTALAASQSKPRCRKLILAALLINLICLLSYVFINNYSKNGLNYAVIAHLVPLLTPATLVQFWPAILLFLSSLISLVYIMRIIGNIIASTKVNVSRYMSLLARYLTPVFVFVAFMLNPLFNDAYELYEGFHKTVELPPLPNGFEDISKLAPDIAYTPPAQKKNFIIVLAESFDSSLTDSSIYPGLTPGLTQLIDERGTQFTGINGLRLSDWTISGIVALFCGVSMYPDLSETKVADEEKDSDFIKRRSAAPNIIGESCIGDILAQDGYTLNFAGGSEFGVFGKVQLFEAQGFKNLYFTDEITDALSVELPLSSWGVYDDALFDFSAQLLAQEQIQPFGFVTLSVDTHEPYDISPSCADQVYGDHQEKVLDAVHCSDKIISNFINKILDSPDHQNTVVFLMSDHLYRSTLPLSTTPRNERDYLFAVFNNDTVLEPGTKIHRAATAYDIAPTILGVLGYDIDTFNFGRNLLKNGPTLSESLTLNQLYENVINIRHKMRDHWTEGFEADKELEKTNTQY